MRVKAMCRSYDTGSRPAPRSAATRRRRRCERHGLEPLADIRRPHVELYARELESRGLAPATVALELVVITGWYRYRVEQ